MRIIEKKRTDFSAGCRLFLILNAHWTAGSVFVGNSALTDFGNGIAAEISAGSNRNVLF